MAVDPGARRVGLALSDEEGRFASPLKTLTRSPGDNLVTQLLGEARAAGAELVVLGLPLRMNGDEGPEAKGARSLARALQKAGLPTVLWDERLTTVAAERQLRASGKRGAAKKALLDQAAATVLLQSYLDAQGPRAE